MSPKVSEQFLSTQSFIINILALIMLTLRSRHAAAERDGSNRAFAQAEQAIMLANGKINRPTKDQLKKQPELPRGRDTHLEVTLRVHANGDDLIGLFRFFAKQRFLEKLRQTTGT